MNNRSIRDELAKTKVSSKRALHSEVKRLAMMINVMKTILWDYIKTSFPHIYEETYAKGKQSISAAIDLIHDEKHNNPSWGSGLVFHLYGYKRYYRLDHILHLENFRKGFKADLIDLKQILKTIKNYKDDEWTLDDVDGVMEELECELLINRVTDRFDKMIRECKWKLSSNVLTRLSEDEEPIEELYLNNDGDEIYYDIIGFNGQWSESSTLAEAIRGKLFANTAIKLSTLSVALESYMNQKIRDAITCKIKDRLRHQEPMILLRADNAKLSVKVAEKEGEIARHTEVNKSLEKERDKLNSVASSRETLYASQEVRIHELSAQNRLLTEQNQQLQRQSVSGRRIYK